MVDSIHSLGGVNAPGMSRRVKNAYRVGDGGAAGADSVQISPEVMRLRGVEGVRFEKVMAIRGAMEAGTYMTPEKLDVALDRALDRLFSAPDRPVY